VRTAGAAGKSREQYRVAVKMEMTITMVIGYEGDYHGGDGMKETTGDQTRKWRQKEKKRKWKSKERTAISKEVKRQMPGSGSSEKGV
jgi:hypothetical protein